jgi:6,7-dimethyl-8-ribityllumazine synthase
MNIDNAKLTIVMSDFNISITNSMKDAAVKYFLSAGGQNNNISIINVPGAFEIPGAVSAIIKKGNSDIIVTIGCIIEGETPHFDYIATETARAIMNMIIKNNIPIGFGVLTTNNMQQAIDRSGNNDSNKGKEAMIAALEMFSVYKKIIS